MSVANLPVLSSDDGLRRYLAEVRKFPVLGAEEEVALARRLRDEGDVSAAHTLVTSHLRLVVKIAFGFKGYGLPMSDLISEGNVGLMKAVKKFDPDRGFRLSTYAMWWIKAAVTEYILQSWSMVKLGTVAAQKKLFFSLRRVKSRLGIPALGDMTPAQVRLLSDHTGVSEDEVVNLDRRLAGRDMSLNTPLPSDEGTEYLDLLADDRADPETLVAEAQEQNIRNRLLRDALAALPARERRIIEQRRLSDEPTRLEDLGNEFGISRERVRQLEVRAFDKLRKLMLEAAPAPA